MKLRRKWQLIPIDCEASGCNKPAEFDLEGVDLFDGRGFLTSGRMFFCRKHLDEFRNKPVWDWIVESKRTYNKKPKNDTQVKQNE